MQNFFDEWINTKNNNRIGFQYKDLKGKQQLLPKYIYYIEIELFDDSTI